MHSYIFISDLLKGAAHEFKAGHTLLFADASIRGLYPVEKNRLC